MQLQKNTRVGKIKLNWLILNIFLSIFYHSALTANVDLEGKITEIKVLDKISSKNTSIKVTNGDEIIHKDLLIKIIKCKNSEFDDNPEITAYIQVKDLNNQNNDDVFVFNGWMFSSSPSIAPFDHPVYDIWLTSCD